MPPQVLSTKVQLKVALTSIIVSSYDESMNCLICGDVSEYSWKLYILYYFNVFKFYL